MARAAVQDGERVNSLYLKKSDTDGGAAVEFGWGWLCAEDDPFLYTNTQSLTLFVVKTYPTNTPVRLTASISPRTRPRLHLRLNPASPLDDQDDYEFFLDNVRIATWGDTHVYPPTYGDYGAERYNLADDNTASWTYCGYSNLVNGAHQWHYLTEAAEIYPNLQDPGFWFYTNKIGDSNHYGYVDDAQQ